MTTPIYDANLEDAISRTDDSGLYDTLADRDLDTNPDRHQETSR